MLRKKFVLLFLLLLFVAFFFGGVESYGQGNADTQKQIALLTEMVAQQKELVALQIEHNAMQRLEVEYPTNQMELLSSILLMLSFLAGLQLVGLLARGLRS